MSQKPREWSRGCGRRCQMPVGGHYTDRHSCRWGARYPSGSLQEGTGHWRPSCCWVTLPSVPPEHSPIPESLIKSGPRPLTSHFPDPQDTTQRLIKPANDAGPGMVKPLLKASCGLHSLLNPSFFRNVSASVKSGPSSSVRSCQTPDDATCSALVRIARSNGGKYLGRKCLPSQAPQWLPEPL